MSEFYEKEFLNDLTNLNCLRPTIILRVTDHIPEIVKFIQKLVDSNQAYAAKSGSVYFNTQAFKIKSFFDPSDSIETEKGITIN